MKWFPGALSACLALVACGGPDPSPQASGATDCGTFTLSQGEQFPEAAARCLIDAASAGRPARLQVTRPTVEGDPIPITYTSGEDGRVEVVTDSRQDKWGQQVITRETCTGPTAAPELTFAQCSDK